MREGRRSGQDSSRTACTWRIAINGIDLEVLQIPAEPDTWPGSFTDAEIETARLLIRGYPYRSIARERSVSEHTVSVQVSAMLSKTGVQSAAALVAALGSSDT